MPTLPSATSRRQFFAAVSALSAPIVLPKMQSGSDFPNDPPPAAPMAMPPFKDPKRVFQVVIINIDEGTATADYFETDDFRIAWAWADGFNGQEGVSPVNVWAV